MRFLLSIILIAFISGLLSAQSSKEDKINPDETCEEIRILLLTELNKIKKENYLDTLEFHPYLDSAATLQAGFMAEHFKVTTTNKKKINTTNKRVAKCGGSNRSEEILGSATLFRGKDPIPNEELVKALLEKWMKTKKDRTILLNGSYIYSGIKVFIDANFKKIYTSVVFGSHNTENLGANKRKSLDRPFSKKQKGLKHYDNYNCKNCDKFKDFYSLYQSMYVENNKVYIKYDDIKAFKKLIKRPKDGIAIDLVQEDQYKNPSYNILDNNLVNKGIIISKLNSKTLYKKNKIKDKKSKTIWIEVGKIPKKIKGNYELNLLIIQNGRVCRTLNRTYIEEGDQNSKTKFEMLLWPDTAAYFKPPFEPKSETNILTFKIPFEKNKYNYKPEDIQPFLNTLQEPDFIIEGLYIYAYSSIEGDSAANAALQKKRASSVIEAIKLIQNGDISTSIITNDSWDLFLLEMEGTKWEYLTQMSKQNAIKEINSKGHAPAMEEYLSKQRFAQIIMDVTYDIRGDKEEKFSLFQFNKAIKKGDVKMALKIQYYIEKCVRNNKYSPAVIDKMEIPTEKKFLPLLMNKVVYRYLYHNRTISKEDYLDLEYISKLEPENAYVNFNILFCKIKNDSNFHQTTVIDEVQKKVELLYGSIIPRHLIDALNIELQFRIIDACDTLEEMQEVVTNAINKIKKIYNIENASWQNALKLSYDLIRFKDFRFACNILEPFVHKEKVPEELLYTFISACANLPDKTSSRSLVLAMEKAKNKNPDRFCKLFGTPYLSFQLLDNPGIKKLHHENCK